MTVRSHFRVLTFQICHPGFRLPSLNPAAYPTGVFGLSNSRKIILGGRNNAAAYRQIFNLLIWSTLRTRYRFNYICEMHVFRGGGLLVWTKFAAWGRTSLVWLQWDLEVIFVHSISPISSTRGSWLWFYERLSESSQVWRFQSISRICFFFEFLEFCAINK